MTTTDAGGAPLQRVVGRLEPERASVGDAVTCYVMRPSPQVLRLTLDSQAAADCFNALPPAERKNWRLEKRIDLAARRSLPPQIPNEFGHLLTPKALWGLYVEDDKTPNA